MCIILQLALILLYTLSCNRQRFCYVAIVAQLVEQRFVVPWVAGSIPVDRPICNKVSGMEELQKELIKLNIRNNLRIEVLLPSIRYDSQFKKR